MAQRVTWAYGVTTVVRRLTDLLPPTLTSLARAGFDNPRIFVDGAYEHQVPEALSKVGVTCRHPALGAYGNWILGLGELFIREPSARLYAMFQDDVLACTGLREYLTRCAPPERSYWNLYTTAENYVLVTRDKSGRPYPEPPTGWMHSNQRGRGALGLVFTKEGLMDLFKSQHILGRPAHARNHDRNIDGAVITAMQEAGYTELVHVPSLLQHTGGKDSTIGHVYRLPTSPCFLGEGWDARTLLLPTPQN